MSDFHKIRYRAVVEFRLWRTISRSRYIIESSLFMVKMRRHMTQSNVEWPSFIEAEQTLKMIPGQDAQLMLSVEETDTLSKILLSKTVESMCTR